MTGSRPTDDRLKAREQRLAEALRANLRRRKTASRARPQDRATPDQEPETADLSGQSGPSDRRS